MFVGQSAAATGEGAPKRRMEWMIDGVAQPTVGPDDSYLGGITFWSLGTHTAQTFTANYDDVISVDNLSAIGDNDEVKARYPIGEGYVKRLAPTGVGTHDTEGAFGTSSGTIADSWQFLDQVPMTGTTDYVLQSTLDTGAYLEYTYGDLDAGETTIHGVAVYAGLWNGSGSVVSDIDVHVVDGGTDSPFGLFTSAASTVDTRTAGVPGSPWTRDRVNALLVRVGYSADADPNPRCSSLFLEVDVVAATPPGSKLREDDYYDALGYIS
jgi:hypothetical protein